MKFEHTMGSAFSTMDLEMGWDLKGEFKRNYKLGISMPKHPGAFVLIRPDNIISHNGYTGDCSAVHYMLESLNNFY